MKKLYYTVVIFSDGLKIINVYFIEDNQPKLLIEIEAYTNTYAEDEIQWWLDNNGYGDDYELEQL